MVAQAVLAAEVLVVNPPALVAQVAQGTLRQQVLLKETAEAVGKYRRVIGQRWAAVAEHLPQEQTQPLPAV